MPSGLDGSPPGRRIFSRITSPFASSTRNITDFSVHADNEHKKYSPGDTVTGHVRLKVVKPARITHVVVCLHGFVQVFKTPGSPGEGFRANNAYLGTGRGKKAGEYFGNGFASLFEDEEVLCGDGRLAESEYRFNFELEFPKRGLPSSIDFERGTISYMVTATLTRPNAMSPTISCDRKVWLAENIDVSRLDPPKARTLTLEPIPKRSRAKTSDRKLVSSSDVGRNSTFARQDSECPRQSDVSSTPSSRPTSQAPASPIPSESEMSFGSRRSSNQRTSPPNLESLEDPTSTPTPSDAAKGSTSRISLVTNKNINVMIEPLAGGCLQGEYVPVKINISHTKPVRSVYGVILTLFRQARVDMRPLIPLGPIEKGKAGKYEDYYPKSLTGLSGLSLSGAGSSHVFRKDLYQSMTPLLIDKHNLTAEVNARVGVPEEAFPTISTVPGAMISFKYYVEVVVDIQGKLQGLEKSANNLSGKAAPTGHFINSEVSDMERSAFTPFGSTIIDTTSVRRDKGVVTFTFEIIIGTKDSERRKGKQKMLDAKSETNKPPELSQAQIQSADRYPDADPGTAWYAMDDRYSQWHEEHPDWYNSLDQHHPTYLEATYDRPPPGLPPVPMPQVPDESQMTEKERIQQAETRLLPSQPPAVDNEDDQSTAGATAPFIAEEGSNGFAHAALPVLPEYRTIATNSYPQVPELLGDGSSQAALDGTASTLVEPLLPSPDYVAAANSENQRDSQRDDLQVEASASPFDTQDDDGGSSSATANQPSAPSLDEVAGLSQSMHIGRPGGAESSELPKYEQ